MRATHEILNLIAAPKTRRADVVPDYVSLIYEMYGQQEPDMWRVKVVNAAIRERWSLYALLFIKREAWRVMRELYGEKLWQQQNVPDVKRLFQ